MGKDKDIEELDKTTDLLKTFKPRISEEEYTEINDYIKNELGRDFTYWDAKGGYDDSRTYIIYTALTKYELIKLERKIKESDFNAFMIKSEGIGIKGEFEKKF